MTDWQICTFYACLFELEMKRIWAAIRFYWWWASWRRRLELRATRLWWAPIIRKSTDVKICSSLSMLFRFLSIRNFAREYKRSCQMSINIKCKNIQRYFFVRRCLGKCVHIGSARIERRAYHRSSEKVQKRVRIYVDRRRRRCTTRRVFANQKHSSQQSGVFNRSFETRYQYGHLQLAETNFFWCLNFCRGRFGARGGRDRFGL